VFILLLDAKRRRAIPEKIEDSQLPQNSTSKLRDYIPRRKYFAVFSDDEFLEELDILIASVCLIEYCQIPDNLAFMIQDDFHSRIERVCTTRETFLTHAKFKLDMESLRRLEDKFNKKYLRSQMECIQIQNSARSLDEIFTQRVHEWEVFAIIHPRDADWLRDPAKVLESFNLRMVLKRLTLRDVNSFRIPKVLFDYDPVSWYFYLNLLARSNASGVISKGSKAKVDHRFKINIVGLAIEDKLDLDMIIIDKRE